MYKSEKKNPNSNFEYYKCQHFTMHGQTVKKQLEIEGATNGVFANLEIWNWLFKKANSNT